MTDKLSYEDWVERFQPEKNNIVDEDRGYDGTMFETYGPEVEFVKEIGRLNPHRVWTLISGDDGGVYLTSGWHYVNRVGYFITAVPCPADEDYEITVGDPDRYYADQIIGSGWIVKDREATGCDIICSVPHGLIHGAEIAGEIADALNANGVELDLSHEDDEDEEIQLPV